MRFYRSIRYGAAMAGVSSFILTTHVAYAGSTMPVLIGKNWLLGYALVFLAVLLGLLAVLIPSMRKKLRKRD